MHTNITITRVYKHEKNNTVFYILKDFQIKQMLGEIRLLSKIHKPEKQGEALTDKPTDSKIKIPELAFIFKPIRDKIKPYHMDCDKTTYTETSTAIRNSLKSDLQVVESIMISWVCIRVMD